MPATQVIEGASSSSCEDLELIEGNVSDEFDDWCADDGETDPFQCAACVELFDTAEATFAHMNSTHAIDILGLVQSSGLTEYQYIRLINYLRTMQMQGSSVTFSQVTGKSAFLNDDAYLRPVIENDPLLYGVDLPFPDESVAMSSDRSPEHLQAQLKEYVEEAKRAILCSDENTAIKTKSAPLSDKEEAFDYYFDSYAYPDIHEQMIKDTVRTGAYHDFFAMNSDWLKGKTVLDIGCGTSILSLFAARYGARHVWGVDNSDIIHEAQQIVIENNMQSLVTLLHKKAEDIELPEKVDIIVSEWMGYFLLFESMLDSVLCVRDKFLKQGGVVMPDRATMHLIALEDPSWHQEKVAFWDNVYGFRMSNMAKGAYNEPSVEIVNPKTVISSAGLLKSLDINKVSVADLEFESSFELQIARAGVCHALLSYFDIGFESCPSPVRFTTAPSGVPTHWKQCVFYLKHHLTVKEGDTIVGSLSCVRSKENHRNLNITITYQVAQQPQRFSQAYKLQ